MTRPKNPQKCRRESCARQEENHGYCRKHMRLHAHIGYVDAAVVYGHIDALRQRGYSLDTLAEMVGCHRTALVRRNNKRFQAELASKILAVPVPVDAWVEGSKSLISAVGTRRRIQALRFMGHSPARIGAEMGVSKQQVMQWVAQRYVTSVTAAAVNEAFTRLSMTAGPSRRTQLWARRRGWLSSLVWEDIDNPDEQPQGVGREKVSFLDRYEDMVSIGLKQTDMPRLLGCSAEALARRLDRLGITVTPELRSLAYRRREDVA